MKSLMAPIWWASSVEKDNASRPTQGRRVPARCRARQGGSPRYVRLLRREIDLHDGDAEFADLRQGLHGFEPSLVGRIDAPLHRLLIAPGGGLVEGLTGETPPVQVQPTRENLIHQQRFEGRGCRTGEGLKLGR